MSQHDADPSVRQATIDAEIADLIADVLGFEPDEYDFDDSFADDLEADSLSVVEMVTALHETYGVDLAADGVLDAMTTPRLVANYIAAHASITGGISA